MYRGFELTIDDAWFDKKPEAYAAGEAIFKGGKRIARESLESLRDASGDLSAEKIIDEWFPDIVPEVFISHSHKDSAQAITLAGWLKQQFDLTAFVDSCAWGCANELLTAIDKKHCYKKDRGTYDYAMRNKSTAHVHIMLNSALMRLVNSSECVFFINTPNAISTRTYIESSHTTESPWLFSELTISRLIQRRSPRDHRLESQIVKSSPASEELGESLNVRYPAHTGHLARLLVADLTEWDERARNTSARGATALDVL